MIVKMSQQVFQDSNCALETTYGSNSISIDYSMGIFCIMSYLRFIVKARNFNNSLYHANTYSLSSLIWRICGGCKFKSIQERNVIVVLTPPKRRDFILRHRFCAILGKRTKDKSKISST